MRAGGASQKGPQKPQNQDAFCRLGESPNAVGRGQLFAVSDGVSTVRLGQWSARLTCLRIEQFFASDQPIDVAALTQLIGEIDWELRGEGHGSAACTLSILWLHGEEAVAIHVGDSAIYRVRHDNVALITQIHGGGRGLAAFMGMGPAVSEVVRVAREPLQDGDIFILVTDGVTDVVEPAELAVQWARSGGDPDAAARQILELVTERKGRDDATAVVVQFLNDGTHERVTDPTNAPDVPSRLLGG